MAQKPIQLITLEDQTSPGTLDPGELFEIFNALSAQLHSDFNHSPWVYRGYAPPARLVPLPPKGSSVPPPPGAWNLILVDTAEVAGALGYHEDSAGTNIPFSDIMVKTAKEDGVDPAEVASHEMTEMLCDPFVVGVPPRQVTFDGYVYVVEVADPVQGCGYKVPGSTATVADFCWPRYFGLAQTRPQLSQRSSVSSPFELAKEGYCSRKPIGAGEEAWEQVFGETAHELPRWASRLPRIHAAGA